MRVDPARVASMSQTPRSQYQWLWKPNAEAEWEECDFIPTEEQVFFHGDRFKKKRNVHQTHGQFYISKPAIKELDALFDSLRAMTVTFGIAWSRSRVIELLCSHWGHSPPEIEFVKNFKFQGKGPGRPRREV